AAVCGSLPAHPCATACTPSKNPNWASWSPRRSCARSPRCRPWAWARNGIRSGSAPAVCRPAEHCACTASQASVPSLASRRVLRLFSQDLLEDVLVQGEVGHLQLQLGVLFAKGAQLLELAHPHAAVLGLPLIEGRLAHAMFPAKVGHLAALLMLAQHRHDLRFRPFALSHCPKVQVDFAVLLSRTPDLGGAYRIASIPTQL